MCLRGKTNIRKKESKLLCLCSMDSRLLSSWLMLIVLGSNVGQLVRSRSCQCDKFVRVCSRIKKKKKSCEILEETSLNLCDQRCVGATDSPQAAQTLFYWWHFPKCSICRVLWQFSSWIIFAASKKPLRFGLPRAQCKRNLLWRTIRLNCFSLQDK